MTRIVTLPGDGIGPEVMAAGLEVLRRRRRRSRSRSTSSAAPRSTPRHRRSPTRCWPPAAPPTRCCSAPSAGPKWDTTDPAKPRPEQGLLGLRKGLGLFANLRPVRAIPALHDASPLREERIAGTDLLVVRELTGGIYFGAKERTATRRVGPLRLHASRRSSGSRASPSAPRARG